MRGGFAEEWGECRRVRWSGKESGGVRWMEECGGVGRSAEESAGVEELGGVLRIAME